MTRARVVNMHENNTEITKTRGMFNLEQYKNMDKNKTIKINTDTNNTHISIMTHKIIILKQERLKQIFALDWALF